MQAKKQVIKLSQEVKRVADHILNPHDRGEFVRVMYQAELDAHFHRTKSRKEKVTGEAVVE